MSTLAPSRTAVVTFAVDAVCVLVFAAAGRQSHEPGSAVATVLVIAWPFLLAALLAHGALVLRGRTATSLGSGAAVLATTYVVGMALRGLSGRGLAPAFLVVAAISLTVLLLGWRAAYAVWSRRRA